MLKRTMTCLLAVALALGPVNALTAHAKDKKLKYAKTEIEKANTACAVMLLLGIGASVAGGKKAARIAIPLTVVACIVIQASARHKERILATKRAALESGNREFRETFQDTDGQNITLRAKGGSEQIVDGARLQPVKYLGAEGQQMAAPAMDTGGKTCRSVGGTLSYDDGRSADLPPQVFCRTAEGDWEPYAIQTA